MLQTFTWKLVQPITKNDSQIQLKQINESTGNPAFIAVSGDLTNRATDAEFEDYTASTATSKLPVYPAVGNHDFAPGSDYKTRIDRYREYLGPEWYSFDYGNRHFITIGK